MNSTDLLDLLGVLIVLVLFLDVASYALLTTHRPLTGLQATVVVVANLAAIGLVAWWIFIARRARKRKEESSAPSVRDRTAWLGWLAVLAHVLAKLQYLNLVPRWDAGTYYGEVLRASAAFDLSLKNLAETFRLAGHPSHAYGMYLALGQILFPFNHYVMNAQNLALAALGIFAFWLVAKKLLPEAKPLLRFLVTLAFGFNPLFFGASMHPNADLSVTVWTVFALAAFVHRRVVLFSFGCLCLAFSKEPGAFMCALLIGLLFVFHGLARAKSLKHLMLSVAELLEFPDPTSEMQQRRVPAWFANLRIVSLALMPLVIFYAYHSSVKTVSWSSSAQIWNDGGVLCFGLNSIMIRNVLYEALLMNFGWIPTLTVIAYLAKCQIWGDKQEAPTSHGHRAVLRVCGYLFACYLVLHCIYINYLNPRYVLALMPLGLLLASHAFARMVRHETKRAAFAGMFVVLCVIQTWRTVDPVSRRLWGTFAIGDHDLILIGGDLQGKADGMVFNAQYTAVERLYRAVNHLAMAKDPDAVLLAGSLHYWMLYYNLGALRVDAKTKAYTTSQKGSIGINFIGLDDPRAGHPYGAAYYVAMPWIEDVNTSLQKLKRFYSVSSPQRVNYGGYYLDVYPLEKLAPGTS